MCNALRTWINNDGTLSNRLIVDMWVALHFLTSRTCVRDLTSCFTQISTLIMKNLNQSQSQLQHQWVSASLAQTGGLRGQAQYWIPFSAYQENHTNERRSTYAIEGCHMTFHFWSTENTPLLATFCTRCTKHAMLVKNQILMSCNGSFPYFCP